LHDGERPHVADRVGQALEPVAHEHEHVVDAAVLDLGQDLLPVLRAFSAVTDPQPEDVSVPLDGDRQGDVDRAVRDLTVADLDVDAVDEQHGVHRVQGPVLPLGHALEHRVGDRADRRLGHLAAVHVGQVRADVSVRHPPRRQRQDDVLDRPQPPLPLGDDDRLERPGPIPRHVDLDRAGLRQDRLGPGPVAGVHAVPDAFVLVIAQVGRQLTLQRGLQDQLGQLRQQPVLAVHAQTQPLSVANQLGHQLPVHQRRALNRRGHLLNLRRDRPSGQLNQRAHGVPPR